MVNLIADSAATLSAVGVLSGMLMPSSPAWHTDERAAIAGAIAAVTLAWMSARVWVLQAQALIQ